MTSNVGAQLAGTALLKAATTRAWLGLFDPDEQPAAEALLRAMLLVSRDAFAERLLTLIGTRAAVGELPIGLYVEREVRRYNGRPNRLFKESTTKVKRAYGVGPPPVQPTQNYDADVGSEGIVAQLVSELCRKRPDVFFNHPGPDKIRERKIRRFVLVTDFIGSGRRAETYLEAAWRVRSVRSWWSARRGKGMSFEVIAYAGTPAGRARVESHPCKPTVHWVAVCPTIWTAFDARTEQEVKRLCTKYSPVSASVMSGYGYDSGGALIAFAHGVPNNAPLILHKGGGQIAPLFPARVTAASRREFGERESLDEIRARLLDLRQKRLALAGSIDAASEKQRALLLVMAALSRPPRTTEALARKTGLTLLEVDEALAVALTCDFIDGQNRLTDAGHAELEQARRVQETAPLPPEAESHYYPALLRAPYGLSS